MSGSSKWAELDIEAVQIMVIVTILAVFVIRLSWSIYAVAVIALLPQGRILVRALVDRPRDKKPVLSYAFPVAPLATWDVLRRRGLFLPHTDRLTSWTDVATRSVERSP
ncbi:MAG: hypothetical protein ACYDHM_09245 [Acidiferrobacterales bacterium]